MGSIIDSKGKMMSLMKEKVQELKERRAGLELGGGSAQRWVLYLGQGNQGGL